MALSKIVADSIQSNAVVGALTDNTVTSAKLTTTGVVANSYGDANNIPVVTVDAQGRVSSVTLANTLTTHATTYSNATSYADTKAAAAYANVFNGGTFTGNVVFTSNVTANTVRLNGTMQVDGDLIVTGNTVTMNVTSLAVEDNMIYLNASSNVANPDLGIAGNYNDGTYRHAGMFRDATDGIWKFFHQYQPEPDASAYIDTSNNTFALANIQGYAFISGGGGIYANGTISGGNTTITGTLVSNAHTMTGNLTITGVTSIVSPDTGALKLASSTSNATNSLGRIIFPGYVKSEADYLGIDLRGLSGGAEIRYGGGSGVLNAVQTHSFFTTSSTNTVNGTERLTIASNGSIGVGTTDLFSPVVIKSDWRSGFGQISLVANTAGATIGHSYHNSSATRLGYASLDSTTNSMSLGVSGTGGKLFLVTNDANRITIDAGGNTAIGTSNTSGFGFNVQKYARFNGLTLGNNDGSNASDDRFLFGWSSGSEAIIYAKQDVPFRLGSNSTTAIYLSGTSLYTIGNMYARAGSAYAAITDLGWTAPIQVQETSTGTTLNRYIPMISGTSLSTSGYRQHTVFGSYRGNAWGNAFIAVGGNDNYPTVAFYFDYGGNFTASGTKNFRIDHPLPSKANTHYLIHAAIEAPQADLIYRGRVDLVNGTATVNIDTAARMTEGTFEVLCRNIQVFTTNETDWVHVRGAVSNNILTIESETPTNATVSWMVVAERDDENVHRSFPVDGRLIVEPLKEDTTPTANT